MVAASVIKEAQKYMLTHPEQSLGGWLIHDYLHSNRIFWQIVGDNIVNITRPCFLLIPATGEARLLVHHVDAGKFHLMGIDLVVYSDRSTMLQGLAKLLTGSIRVAMEYSPVAALPRSSNVDAGTVELVRSIGVEVVSSADLLQYATQRWSQGQLSSHLRSADKLGRIVVEAFQYIGRNLDEAPTEYQVSRFIRDRFKEEGIHSPDGPIVAANGHASDPHYEPSEQGSSIFKDGDWVLIDLWAKEQAEDAVYADITWVAYVGGAVPHRYQEVFDVVATARDAAFKYLEGSSRQGIVLQGCQVDMIARDYIVRQGYGDYFTHRLGHSIGRDVHADAVNLDGFETEDTRSIVPGICFSIEPGIYLPEFGVRSEIDVFMTEDGPTTTTCVQRDVVLIGP